MGYSDFINRLRDEVGMGGRDMGARLKDLGGGSDPAEKALVLRQFTKYAEAPVSISLDKSIFERWYKGLQKSHRSLPGAHRKSDADICEYLNILMYAQPDWRQNFELRMSSQAGLTATGHLAPTLAIIRKMLGTRAVYAQLDAEQQGGGINHAFSVTPASSNTRVAGDGTNESNSIKRAFATLVQSGDTAAAFAVASQAGLTRSTADPKKNPKFDKENGGGGGGGGDTEYTPMPRDANGAIKSFPIGGKPCFCGKAHLHRECDQTDMWSRDGSGRWLWNGGRNWTNGNPPAGFDRATAAKKMSQNKSPSPSPSKHVHAAKVVSIGQGPGDQDLAAQLAALWEETDGNMGTASHSAKVVTLDSGCTAFTRKKTNHSANDYADITITPIESDQQDIATDPCITDSCANVTTLESSLRRGVATIKSAIYDNHYTLWCFAFLIISIVLMVPLFVTPMTATSAGVMHPAIDKVPTSLVDPRYQRALAVTGTTPAPSSSVSSSIMMLFCWLVGVTIYFKPAFFSYVAINFPFDVARVVAYCSLAAPLAFFPSGYRAVFGLGRGNKSFFAKAVCSINNLRVMGVRRTIRAARPRRHEPLAALAVCFLGRRQHRIRASLPRRRLGTKCDGRVASIQGQVASCGAARRGGSRAFVQLRTAQRHLRLNFGFQRRSLQINLYSSHRLGHCRLRMLGLLHSRLSPLSQRAALRRGLWGSQWRPRQSHTDRQPPAHCARRQRRVHSLCPYQRQVCARVLELHPALR